MNMEKYLPIGTVCTIRNYQKSVMIIGTFSVEYSGKVKMYDYQGCDYPEGLLLNNKIHSFNHEDIEKVLFVGYKDEFYEAFNANITAQNTPSDDSSYEEKSFAKNIQFDANGVVIYEPIKTSNYRSNVTETVTTVEKEKNINNPFVPVQNKAPVTTTDSQEWSIFKNIQFDENGIVIAAEEFGKEE